ncbi:MAG: response regulator [Deltaproteobacteria bacterium]|nr:response regulator [Deltaproteobacteria bacterium]
MKRILVVGDHKEIRNLLSKFFLLNGYEVDTVEDGETAMKKVKEKGYDLVVTDYMMPKMDGIELIRRLKGYDPSLSILIISGSGVGEPFFREVGADAFLAKPLDLSSMKILVEEILNSKIQISEPDH